MHRCLQVAFCTVLVASLASPSLAQSLFGNSGGGVGGGGSRLGGGGTAGPGGASNPTSVASDAGRVTGNERFLRENRTAGQFVGADAQELSNNFIGALGGLQSSSAAGGAGQRGAGGRQLGGAGANRGQQQNRNNSRSRKINYAMKLSIGFKFDGLSKTQVNNRMQTAMTNILASQQLTDVRITLRDRIAIIQGTVPSNDDKKLLTRLVELEPGVSKVQNEVAVESPIIPPPSAEFIPPPTGG